MEPSNGFEKRKSDLDHGGFVAMTAPGNVFTAERLKGGSMLGVLTGDGTEYLVEAGIGVALVDVPNEKAIRRDGLDRVVIRWVRRLGDQADYITVPEIVLIDLSREAKPSQEGIGGFKEDGGGHRHVEGEDWCCA